MHSDFFSKTDKVNFEKTTGAAVSDLFREKLSSKKALQEYVAKRSHAPYGRTGRGGRRAEGR